MDPKHWVRDSDGEDWYLERDPGAAACELTVAEIEELLELRKDESNKPSVDAIGEYFASLDDRRFTHQIDDDTLKCFDEHGERMLVVDVDHPSALQVLARLFDVDGDLRPVDARDVEALRRRVKGEGPKPGDNVAFDDIRTGDTVLEMHSEGTLTIRVDVINVSVDRHEGEAIDGTGVFEDDFEDYGNVNRGDGAWKLLSRLSRV